MHNVLAVPVSALSFTPNENLLKDGETIADCQAKSKVWVREGNVFKAIPVETGENNGILAEIKNGLKGGEDVITEFCIEQRIQEEESGNQNPFMPHPGRNKNKKQ